MPGPKSQFEDTYPAIRDLCASGLSPRQAVIRVMGSDKSASWCRFLQSHPAYAAEIDALRYKGRPSVDAIGPVFDAILRRIEKGDSPQEAGRALGVNGDRVTEWLLRHPDRRPAYASAMKKRAKRLGIKGSAVSKVRRRDNFTEEQFDAALLYMARLQSTDVNAALRKAGLPTGGSFRRRALKDDEFAKRLAAARAAFNANSFHLRYLRGGDVSTAGLLRDPLFAKLWRKYKGRHEARFDLISEAYVAIISGEITFDDLKSKRAANTINRRAMGNRSMFVSLDEPRHDEDNRRETEIDAVASPTEIQFW